MARVAAAAHAAGCQQARRQAFGAAGSANTWKLPRRFFGSFTAILDFIHAWSYVFAAAQAGRKFAAAWRCDEQWLGWVGHGQVGKVIAALEERPQERGLPVPSSLMESAVQQVKQRMTGTEQLWSEAGGAALLQWCGDHLSDGEILEAFWQRRQDNATGHRRYRKVG